MRLCIPEAGAPTPPWPGFWPRSLPDKTHAPPPTTCVVIEGAENKPTQAHVWAPRGPDRRIMGDEWTLHLSSVAVNHNPSVRL